MNSVRIAALKSRLSEHLRKVRSGSTLTILDRETPIARIVPWQAGESTLRRRLPLAGSPAPGRLKMPPALRLRTDVVALLLEARRNDR